ncbi:hypothetical protein [Ornithinimicrobium kibberense]|uniref:hypothetical protein n=1 Tax=Ornithinimicrobium kibberense TaxID=282060 RepID=UPI00360A2722
MEAWGTTAPMDDVWEGEATPVVGPTMAGTIRPRIANTTTRRGRTPKVLICRQ